VAILKLFIWSVFWDMLLYWREFNVRANVLSSKSLTSKSVLWMSNSTVWQSRPRKSFRASMSRRKRMTRNVLTPKSINWSLTVTRKWKVSRTRSPDSGKRSRRRLWRTKHLRLKLVNLSIMLSSACKSRVSNLTHQPLVIAIQGRRTRISLTSARCSTSLSSKRRRSCSLKMSSIVLEQELSHLLLICRTS